MSGSRRSAGDRSIEIPRGQTTLDFVLAIGVFIVAVAFVFGFVPGMLDPFTQDQAEGPVADRTADAVVDELTDDIGSPAELNGTKTATYFVEGTDLAERVGVASTYDINVTVGRPIEGASGVAVLCSEGGVQPCTAGGEALQVGQPVPASSTTVATARRTVIVDDRIAIVLVRVWS